MKNNIKTKGKFRFTKGITLLIVIHGLLMITASYLLAFLGREPVSDVSTTLVTQVVAPTLVYLITNCIGNIFEKNELIFSSPIRDNNSDEGDSQMGG